MQALLLIVYIAVGILTASAFMNMTRCGLRPSAYIMAGVLWPLGAASVFMLFVLSMAYKAVGHLLD